MQRKCSLVRTQECGCTVMVSQRLPGHTRSVKEAEDHFNLSQQAVQEINLFENTCEPFTNYGLLS